METTKERIVDLYRLDFLGTVLREKEPLLARLVGTATDKNTGNQYQTFHTPEGEMVIQSKVTGKKFIVRWNDVLTLGLFRGLDRDVSLTEDSQIIGVEGADFRNV